MPTRIKRGSLNRVRKAVESQLMVVRPRNPCSATRVYIALESSVLRRPHQVDVGLRIIHKRFIGRLPHSPSQAQFRKAAGSVYVHGKNMGAGLLANAMVQADDSV